METWERLGNVMKTLLGLWLLVAYAEEAPALKFGPDEVKEIIFIKGEVADDGRPALHGQAKAIAERVHAQATKRYGAVNYRFVNNTLTLTLRDATSVRLWSGSEELARLTVLDDLPDGCEFQVTSHRLVRLDRQAVKEVEQLMQLLTCLRQGYGENATLTLGEPVSLPAAKNGGYKTEKVRVKKEQ
jgi:hypothetical protein